MVGADVWNLSPVWKPSRLSLPEGGEDEGEAGREDHWGTRTTSFLASPCTGFHGIQVPTAAAAAPESRTGTDSERALDGQAEEMRDLAEVAIGESKQFTPLASPLPPSSPTRFASPSEGGL